MIKYFTNNQYYVTDLIIQRVNIDFQYVVLPMWEKPGVRNSPVRQPAVLFRNDLKEEGNRRVGVPINKIAILKSPYLVK